MDWTSKKRLQIIKAVVAIGPEDRNDFAGFKQRIMFLCDMPDQFLEDNKDKYAGAIKFAQADITIEIWNDTQLVV